MNSSNPTTIQVGSWADLHVLASAVRTAVFVQEQGIPAHEEWDADDATALHAVAVAEGDALATGRLLQPAPGVGRVGRMAVLKSQRGAGLGRQILDALVAAALARGDRLLELNAQRSAELFYAGAGFAPEGTEFDEVGIPHIRMVRTLG